MTPLSPQRILLVEDRPASLTPLRQLLESRGHRVDAVEGVLYAMWSVNASHRVYDAVLCAVELTDGDAVELITHLRQRMGVRTIALARRGCDSRALHRVTACPAIDRVLTYPGGAHAADDAACAAVCDAVSELMSPGHAPVAESSDPSVHPTRVA